MTDTVDNMVLRTVYLPLALDRELRQLAFSRDVSKADLIRDFIHQGLKKVDQSGEKTLAARVQERIKNRENTIETALASSKKASKSKAAGRRRSAPRKVIVSAA